jgi:geranylgeranylglycerol-phosphate geranylgeranyltransferase
MHQILPYFKIIRINNVIIAGLAVIIGAWISQSTSSAVMFFLLFFSAAAATGYGNLINDILDIDTDRISHPDRPLPQNQISIRTASVFAIFLSFLSAGLSFLISSNHGMATIIPLLILTIYSFFLKRLPLIGNVVVASLVAYAILYGAINSAKFSNLIIPAILAFLLNFSREIIKDIQDKEGDLAQSMKTTAIISESILKKIIYGTSVFYLLLLFTPFFLKHFGLTYALFCLLITLPIHIYRTAQLTSTSWPVNINKISLLYKIEMLSGLFALISAHLIG